MFSSRFMLFPTLKKKGVNKKNSGGGGGHIVPDFHYCCVRRVECIGGDLYTTLSGLFQEVFIFWHFILNEHGGGFLQNKNRDITSYMML